jgi:tetratricopeptide (TPR) repeat protein
MLGYALDRQTWADADSIVRALNAYWDTRGLGGEADAWADRILDATAGDGQGPSGRARSLWLYTTIVQANRQNDAGQPDRVGQTYRRALAYLQDQPETEWTRTSITVVYHQLGITAQGRGRLDEAEGWYRRAIQIREELGLRAFLATDYHQLGMIAQDRGRLEEAEDWYRRSLAINEELGDRPSLALTYAQLGLLAEKQNEAQLALGWNIRSVTLFDQFPSRLTGTGPAALARLSRQLGTPAMEAAWHQVTGQPVPQPVRDYLDNPTGDTS